MGLGEKMAHYGFEVFSDFEECVVENLGFSGCSRLAKVLGALGWLPVAW